jgi:outer membrane protein assembly factor BamB
VVKKFLEVIMSKFAATIAALFVGAAVFTSAHAEDWPMWGRTPDRRMNSPEKNPPTSWDVEKGTNIKWASQLGSQSYANPVIAGGLVFVGTNNESKRDPSINEDAGCLMIFRESDGAFLYQRVSLKLKAGRVNDWPYQGICSTVCAEGDFIWYCTNRCEVVCLDVSPLRRGEAAPREVWVVDMMATLGVFPHNMTSCSPVIYKDNLYIITANGIDVTHKDVPSPKAPAIVCFNKKTGMDPKTGKPIWSDNAPGEGILHGQWSSPSVNTINGRTQVLCAEGDSWVRSYDALTGELLWKFDCNTKDSVYPTIRNELIATPVVVDNLMYISTGQDPEHGEGPGHIWCVDVSRGQGGNDLSLELDSGAPAPKPGQELVTAPENVSHKGVPNPNSAVVWHFAQKAGANGKVARKDRMNRSISTVAVENNICIAPDFSGFLHVFDAKTGEPLWTYDMEAAMWGSPLICDGKIFVCNEEGNVSIFELSRKMNKIAENPLGSASYCSPVFANGVLYVTSREKLFAIQKK